MAYTEIKGDGNFAVLVCVGNKNSLQHKSRSVLFLQNKQAAAYKLITERIHATHPQPLQSIWKIRSNEPRTQKGDREWEEDGIKCSQITIKKLEVQGEKVIIL